MKIYTKILHGAYEKPEHFSANMNDLIQNLLVSHPKNRYGTMLSGVNDIKNHIWFSSINWDNLLQKAIKPPFVPKSDKDYYETYEEEPLTYAEAELYPTVFDKF